jgi:hypothetical protein
MRNVIVVVLLTLLGGPAIASQEQIHPWKTVSISAATKLFGDVEMKATGDTAGNLKTLDVVIKGKTLTVPAKWIATLPAMPLSSLEIRTERGYDPEPWLYAYFQNGADGAKGTIELHISFQGGKLKDAATNTHDGKGNAKFETKKGP